MEPMENRERRSRETNWDRRLAEGGTQHPVPVHLYEGP